MREICLTKIFYSLNNAWVNNYVESAVKKLDINSLLNPFHTTCLFLYPLKTLENERYSDSDVFRGYRKRPVS